MSELFQEHWGLVAKLVSNSNFLSDNLHYFILDHNNNSFFLWKVWIFIIQCNCLYRQMQFSNDIKLYVKKRTLQALVSIFYDDCVDSWMIYV